MITATQLLLRKAVHKMWQVGDHRFNARPVEAMLARREAASLVCRATEMFGLMLRTSEKEWATSRGTRRGNSLKTRRILKLGRDIANTSMRVRAATGGL